MGLYDFRFEEEDAYIPYGTRRDRPVFWLYVLMTIGVLLFFFPMVFQKTAAREVYKSETITLTTMPPEGYTYLSLSKGELKAGNLVLVNGSYSCEEISQEAHASVYENKRGSYQVSNTNLTLHKDAIQPLNELMDGFYAVAGPTDILVASGFRDFHKQSQLYGNAGEGESAFVNQPEHSEHHTGYALDLSIYTKDGLTYEYDGTGIYAWINENCDKYGFVIRYAQDKTQITQIGYEPWHLRYVGVPHATIMKENNYCLEEYIDYLRDFGYGQKHLNITVGQKHYEIYYVVATTDTVQVPVPTTGSYTLSGNNVDGFVVTVEK
ncbi:M15 family metallopeptidase [Eubacteriales bacterium OttesenSCG-928-M02]|nr:M15 family metallopeptidase [Eubacteriales bacterium OttesenSCG-928-M02]